MQLKVLQNDAIVFVIRMSGKGEICLEPFLENLLTFPWNLGTLELWKLGTLEPWNLGA